MPCDFLVCIETESQSRFSQPRKFLSASHDFDLSLCFKDFRVTREKSMTMQMSTGATVNRQQKSGWPSVSNTSQSNRQTVMDSGQLVKSPFNNGSRTNKPGSRTIKNLKSLVAGMLFVCCCLVSSAANAHFIWLAPVKASKVSVNGAASGSTNGSTTLQVYFGEDASPDDPAYLGRVKEMSLQRVSGTQSPTPLELIHTDESLSAVVSDYKGKSLFIGTHDLGVFDRGNAKFRLKYYAKGGPSIANKTWQRTKVSDDLTLDLVPSFNDAVAVVTVLFKGKPVANSQVVVSGPGLDDFEGETDDKGKAEFEPVDAGVYSIRARHIDATAGELDGKTYPETRHYVTAAVRIPKTHVTIKSQDLATIPEVVTSFGAAITNGGLYVYGGHTGSAHSYSKQEQGNTLHHLNLKTKVWQTLGNGPHLQGLAMVAHKGLLYRVGGFTAKNAEGEEHDLWSQADVARFDPQSKKWSALPPLPEARSSHDAAIVGDAIYVIGGWAMSGERKTWHSTAWKMDLTSATPSWESVSPPPVKRRAIAVAAHGDKLYVIGGMPEKGGPTRRVDVLDTKTGKWSQGPDLVGEDGMTGFGASSFATGGQLYVTTVKGTLQKLSADGSKWNVVGRTPTPRFFHRLLPLDAKTLLVVGGANMSIGKFEAVETLTVAQ